MKSVLEFRARKLERRPITMVTSYDFWSARTIDSTELDCILVGDSVAMVVHGYPNTLAATPEMMSLHTAAVARGAPSKFIVGDMPFLSFRKGLVPAMECVQSLMAAGAHAVKLEGVQGHEDVIQHIVRSGVPVMGHLGLTPQSIHQLGGFKVQGRDRSDADELVAQARLLEDLGCFAVVLECVPSVLAKEITEAVSIPTIGIGAGVSCDGQVLVLQDLLGLNTQFKPKFVRHFLKGEEILRKALSDYDCEVKNGLFPSENETYS